MRFLVIDDSDLDRQFLTGLLENANHQVDTCSSSQEAADRIKGNKYDSVFLDIVMPEKDGYKLLREIRSDRETAEQHIVFCSSKKTPLEVNYGLKRGANEYLTKPVSAADIEKLLQSL